MARCRPSYFTLRALPRVALLFALCAFPFAAAAQTASATLSGTVLDPNGAVVPAANITVTETATGVQRTATTNEQGYFTIPLLKPSTYNLRVEHQGFLTAEVRDIVLNVGDERSLRIPMKVGDVKETVNVTGEAPLINESAAVGTIVDRQFAANIPLNGRSFQSLITLTPGVILVPGSTSNTGQFSVNGQRASANSFTVDGVSANFGTAPNRGSGAQTSGNLPGLTTFGTTQSLVSVDALQEFKVETSTYAAEYGRQPGGQVSIITRSGTNQFHGSLFDYLRNDKLDANDWFANRAGQPRPPERQNDFGGTFSGPVLLPRFGEGGDQLGYNGHNRTFFFFSYEGLRLRLPTFTLTNVPTVSLRQVAPAGTQPLANAFPLPNGRDLNNGLAEFSASYSDSSTLNATSIRIDHTINSRMSLFGRYTQAPSQSKTRSTANLSLVNANLINTKTLTLGSTAFLTSRLLNEFKINVSDNYGESSLIQDNFGGATPLPRNALIPAAYDSSTAQGSVAFLFPGRTSASTPGINFFDKGISSQRQFNIINNISFGAGSHHFKLGMDYRRLSPINEVNSYVNNSVFTSSQAVLNSRASTVNITSFLPAKPLYTNFSVYGQDTWKLSRLTLDLGVRWEVNPAPGEANGNLPPAVTQITNLSSMQLASRGTKMWNTTYNNFAPRIGFAYQVRQNPGRELVLRGGFGVFYDTGNEFSSSQFPFGGARSIPNVTYPLNPSQVAPPLIPFQTGLTPPYPFLNVFDPNLKLPYTLQWNVAAEQSFGPNQVFSLSYVGAAGRRLLQRRQLSVSSINPSFTNITLTTNAATSDYHGLQAQFQRRLSRRLQALVSYTWSHAIDDDSFGNTSRPIQRGNASFDVRHIVAAAVTYDIPSPKRLGIAREIASGWSVDTTIHAQSAFPIDIVASTVIDPVTGDIISVRPNVISDVPLYVDDPNAPGGRILNNTVPTAAQIAAAGCLSFNPTTPNAKGAFCTPSGQSGNLGRNIIRGLPASQVDLALRRKIKLTEKLSLQLRAEAFNIFNHPNFGAIQTTLSAPNFGQATNMLNRQLGGLSQLYQIGGPRSLQFALKVLY